MLPSAELSTTQADSVAAENSSALVTLRVRVAVPTSALPTSVALQWSSKKNDSHIIGEKICSMLSILNELPLQNEQFFMEYNGFGRTSKTHQQQIKSSLGPSNSSRICYLWTTESSENIDWSQDILLFQLNGSKHKKQSNICVIFK